MIEDPAQSLCQRQELFEEVPQLGLVQHFTSAGSLGQAPLMATPPEEEQVDVVTQTPGYWS